MGDETVVVMMTVLKRAYAISVKRELLPVLCLFNVSVTHCFDQRKKAETNYLHSYLSD